MKEIRFFRLVDNYYKHPEAPECSLIKVTTWVEFYTKQPNLLKDYIDRAKEFAC